MSMDTLDLEPLPVQVAAPRRCLSCSQTFASFGAGNRICPRCRRLDSWKNSVPEYSARY